MEETPHLTYFCELDAQPLRDLFSDPEVTQLLAGSHAAVSLGILDLSDERAEVVRGLNQAGVPVTAWLLLPKEEGYWFNLDNAPQAARRYKDFQAWSRQHALRWARIGIDIEPDIRAFQLIARSPLAGVLRLLGRAFERNRLSRGRQAYGELVRRIQADGYPVEAYHIPLIIDERTARSTLLQRLTGMVDLPEVDHEVHMLYSSFLRPWGQGVLLSYAPYCEAIAAGVTGGGVELEGAPAVSPLNWPELQEDLLLARQHTREVYIFSLEGCVRQNLLQRLRDFDWQQPVQIPYSAAQRVEAFRKTFRRALWLLERPAWIFFGLAMLVSLVSFLSRKKKHRLSNQG